MPTAPFLGIADPLSTLTHLLGALVALTMAGRLIRRGRGRPVATASLTVFAASCILLLATSGIYHMFAHGTAVRELFQRLDHAAIFILIAGTFTPVHAILFRGPSRWGVLIGIWGAALVAITLKTIFFEAVPEALGIGLYLGLGWVGAVTGWVLWRHFGAAFVRPALLGGLAYTIGGLIGFAGAPNPIPGVLGAHEVFHFASLAGVYCFWRFIGAIVEVPAIGRPGRRGRVGNRPSREAAQGGAFAEPTAESDPGR